MPYYVISYSNGTETVEHSASAKEAYVQAQSPGLFIKSISLGDHPTTKKGELFVLGTGFIDEEAARAARLFPFIKECIIEAFKNSYYRGKLDDDYSFKLNENEITVYNVAGGTVAGKYKLNLEDISPNKIIKEAAPKFVGSEEDLDAFRKELEARAAAKK